MNAPFLNLIDNPAYYNDFDKDAVAWLRELIRRGLIAPGEVDERSILDVSADDLKGFTQCHFFAGIGGWSYALRLAGWPDDRPVWTGSPPCQPFSVSGKGLAKDDPRHLAPKFISLVRAGRPAVLFGEQVASSAVFGKVAGRSRKRIEEPPAWAWLDDLLDRLEAAHYAAGAVDFPSAGIGAPHIRQRTYFGAVDTRSASDWLGDCYGEGSLSSAQRRVHRGEESSGSWDGEPERCRAAGRMVNGVGSGLERHRRHVGDGHEPGWQHAQSDGSAGSPSAAGRLEHADSGQFQEPRRRSEERNGERSDRSDLSSVAGRPGPLNGFWRNADWVFCRDDKWRPVEAGTFPLANGLPARVGRLRGYGNAINPVGGSGVH